MQEHANDFTKDDEKVSKAVKLLKERYPKDNERSLEYVNGAIAELKSQLARVQADSKRLKLEAAIRRWERVLVEFHHSSIPVMDSSKRKEVAKQLLQS